MNTWYVRITTQIQRSYTQKTLYILFQMRYLEMGGGGGGSWIEKYRCFCVGEVFSVWWVLRWRLAVPDRKRKLCCEVSGNVQLWLDGLVWVLSSDETSVRQHVRTAPRSWPGKDPAGRCPDDLYTSPVHPPPPASSAHHLYQQAETEVLNYHVTHTSNVFM